MSTLYCVNGRFRWSMSTKGMTLVFRNTKKKYWYSKEALSELWTNYEYLLFEDLEKESSLLEVLYTLEPEMVWKGQKDETEN